MKLRESNDDEDRFVIGGTRRLIALRAVVEFDRFERKSIVELATATMIKMIGNITRRTKNTSKNAAIADLERFSRHRWISGLNNKYCFVIFLFQNLE